MDLREQLQSTLGDGFTLDRELGGGGMSHVFVATEHALGRQIVVKTLPLDSGATVSAERFKREIMVAARLQHPHIVPVLSAGESKGLPFYTMPYVKGESLRMRLAKGGELSVNETVHILRDVASAIAYAHAEGVVHRDIKPENVILSGGVAVVTDFGIAKAMDASISDGGSPKTGLTSLGVALGTPAYMAPEQATADPHVDHRADIYSFGCIAYEMLAGSSPFAGRPLQQLLTAHVAETPQPVLARRPNVPPALAALVMKCLEKRPGDRPQTANEVIAALDAVATPSGGTAPTSARLSSAPRRRDMRLIGLVALIVVVVSALALGLGRPSFTPLQVGPTIPIAVSPDLEGDPAISPDGKLVAYATVTPQGSRIFVRQIDGGRANLLTGDVDGDNIAPRWAPDGSRISFISDGIIWVVPALGGTPKRLIDDGQSPTRRRQPTEGTHAWSPDGKSIAVTRVTGLWVRTLSDGQERQVVSGAFVHSPAWSPDGRLLAYSEGRRPTLNNISTNVVWVVPASGGAPIRISDSTRTNASPAWAADGRSVLFVSSVGGIRDIYQRPVRSDGRPSGERVRLTTGLSPFTLSLSADGTRMAYDVVRNFSNVWSAPVPTSGSGTLAQATAITRENQHVESMDVSRDGQWLTYDSDRAGNFDIYKLHLDGGEPIQLTTAPSNEFHPVWSPDGQSIAFHSQRGGFRHIYVMNADGNGETQITRGETQDYCRSWSPDGRSISFGSGRNVGNRGYLATYVTKDASGAWSTPKPLAADSDAIGTGYGVWSPDGKTAAYTANGNIMMMPTGGGTPTVFATQAALGGPAIGLAWPQSGMLFVSVGGSETFRIVKIVGLAVPSGAQQVALTSDATHHFGREEFSTDGRRLFFTMAAYESDVGVMELTKRR